MDARPVPPTRTPGPVPRVSVASGRSGSAPGRLGPLAFGPGATFHRRPLAFGVPSPRDPRRWHRGRRCLSLLLLGLLVSCETAPPADQAQAPSTAAPASPPAQAAPSAAAPAASAPWPSDLIGLPSPGAALNAVPIGRSDPFAPLQTPQARRATLPLPAGFQLRGLLRVNGRDQAFVQTASGSGVLCLGPRGRCSDGAEPLLPPGLQVVAIQPRLGCITVAGAGQRQRFCLQGS